MNKLVKTRKVCKHCKMNALFTNIVIDLSNYGSVTYAKKLSCENCGTKEK